MSEIQYFEKTNYFVRLTSRRTLDVYYSMKMQLKRYECIRIINLQTIYNRITTE